MQPQRLADGQQRQRDRQSESLEIHPGLLARGVRDVQIQRTQQLRKRLPTPD